MSEGHSVSDTDSEELTCGKKWNSKFCLQDTEGKIFSIF